MATINFKYAMSGYGQHFAETAMGCGYGKGVCSGAGLNDCTGETIHTEVETLKGVGFGRGSGSDFPSQYPFNRGYGNGQTAGGSILCTGTDTY